MALEVTTASAPAYWASYLINGDASGFDYSNTPDNPAGDRDMEACDAWVASLAEEGWYVVDVARDDDGEGIEPRFTEWHDAQAYSPLAGDVVDYVLHRKVKP